MDRLPAAVAAALGDRVRYEAAVVRVTQDSQGVQVEYLEHGQRHVIAAGRVILAVPFSTLRAVDLRSAVSAPTRQAITELPYFPAVRFLLQATRRFWEAEGLSASARTDDPAEIWDATYDLPGPTGILAATAGGAIGDRLAGVADAEARRFGLNLVARAFVGFREVFARGVAVRWAHEPWALGAFAVCRPGQMTTLVPGVARPEGRIHFAGEHTSPWMGWMEGALESGERAAREVLAA